MKLTIERTDSDLIIRYRVYHRRDTSFKTYVAKITSPHPDYILNRCFLDQWANTNPRWNLYTYLLTSEGIYEISVKHFDTAGNYLLRERKWLVYYGGEIYEYENEEMNNQYVLYCAGLLENMRERAS